MHVVSSLKFVLVQVFCAALGFAASAADYWVATNGTDAAGTGAEDAPFATIRKALEVAVSEGDVVKVKAGTYELGAAPAWGSRAVKDSPMYLVTNAVSVIGVEGADKTIIDGKSAAANNRYAFYIDNAKALVKGITLKNVKSNIDYNKRESATFNLVKGAVENCIVTNCAFYYVGAYALKSTDAHLLNCVADTVSCSDGLSLSAGIYCYANNNHMTVSNCVVRNATARQSAALMCESAAPRIYGCVFSNCTSSNTGRGGKANISLYNGTLMENCVISDNRVTSTSGGVGGGGLKVEGANTIVRNCLIVNNSEETSTGGGGVYMTGGLLENCTIAGNKMTVAQHAHGVYQTGGTIRNCIIANNNADKTAFDPENHYRTAGTVEYTCTYPEMPGTGNMMDDPYFMDIATGDFRLSDMSDLYDKGSDQAWMTTTLPVDLAGNARIMGAAVNLGCYEQLEPAVKPIALSILADVNKGAASLTVHFSSTVKNTDGNVSYAWDFGDGSTSTEANPVHVYTQFGVFPVSLTVTDATQQKSVDLSPSIMVGTSVAYVNTTGSGVWPFDTPEKGTNSTDAAIENLYAPQSGGKAVLHIAAGTYSPKARIHVRDIPIDVLGENGATLSGSGLTDKNYGVVELDNADSVVSNLVFTGISCTAGTALTRGGALTVYQGLACDCTIVNPYTSSYTKGAFNMTGGRTERLLVYGATNGDSGAGNGGRGGFYMTGGTLIDSVFSNCTATCVGAGEVAGGIVSNCLFYGCSASSAGNYMHVGGVYITGAGKVINSRFVKCGYTGTSAAKAGALKLNHASALVRNCLVVEGSLKAASAVQLVNGTMESCTIATNVQTAADATTAAGVSFEGGTLRNCIVYGNTDFNNAASELSGSGADHCLTADDPKFRNPAKGDYRLLRSSPAVNAGLAQSWMTGAIDLFGNPRVKGDAPDIGCYENPLLGLRVIVW